MKVVGEIKPPDYKNPATMLRNIADDIESGKYGEINTIVVATGAEDGFAMFSGGRDSDLAHSAYLFGTALHRLYALPWGNQ